MQRTGGLSRGFIALMYLEIEIFRGFSEVEAEIARSHVVHVFFVKLQWLGK